MAHELRRRNGFSLVKRLSGVGIASAATLISPTLITPAGASPLGFGGDNGTIKRALEARDDDSTVQIWVPIIVIALFIIAAIAMYTYRRAKAATAVNSQPRNAAGNTSREITAEQLAGTINNGAQNQTNANGAATRTRRARRPRRTPSQISTRSLPVYAKEPGEEEVVIARGTEDTEDVTMPAATVMDSVTEDGEDSLHSRNASRASQYPPLPASPNPDGQPLLHDDESEDDEDENDHTYPPRRENAEHRQSTTSYDTSNASDETTSLMRADSRPNPEDPRGPTPAYFEAIDSPFSDEHGTRSPMTSTQSPTSPSTTTTTDTGTVQQRRSGFRNLIGSIPNRLSMSHTRGASTLSAASTDQSHNRETSQSRASHRATASNSSSFINLSPFRSRSRQQSIPNMQNLTSPSLISLASISAPLTHTATRTEFTYPKAGPTPEQLKLISSRESFGRFGVPYGPDALAFAASQERVDLSVPPPDFETASASPSIGGPSSPPPGPSRLRSSLVDGDDDAEDALDRPVEAFSDLMDAHAAAASHAVADTPQSIAVAPVAATTVAAAAEDDVLSPSLARSSETAPEPEKEDESSGPDSPEEVNHVEAATIPLPPSPPASPKAEPAVLPEAQPETHSDSEDGDGDVSDDTKEEDDEEDESEDSEDSEDEQDHRKRDTIMVPPKQQVVEDGDSDSDDDKDNSKRATIMVPKHALPPLSIPPSQENQNQVAEAPSTKPPPSSYAPPQPKSSAAGPPSAFRPPSSFSMSRRPESRASSIRSYATAAESMHAPSTAYHTDYYSDDDYVSGRETPADMYESAYDDEEDDDEEAATPTTPKNQSAGLPQLERTPVHDGHELGNGHAVEASDATVRGPAANPTVRT